MSREELTSMLELSEKKALLLAIENDIKTLDIQVLEIETLGKGRTVYSRIDAPTSHVFFLQDRPQFLATKKKDLDTKRKQCDELKKEVEVLRTRAARIIASYS